MVTSENRPADSPTTSPAAVSKEASAPISAPTKVRPKWLRYITLTVVVLLVAIGFSAVSFYGAEISAYWKLRGWNKGAAADVVTRFMQTAQQQKGEEALALVDPGSYKPLSEKNRVVGLQKVDPSGMGAYKVYFNELVPAANPEVQPVYLMSPDAAGDTKFVVPVKFSNGTAGDFLVNRVNNEYKIAGVPLTGKLHMK